MFSLVGINSVGECRSFIAALCNISEFPEHTYIDRDNMKAQAPFLYKNGFDKPSFNTKQIFDAIRGCTNLLQAKGVKINEEERQFLLKNLKKGLKRYEHKMRAFFKIHWLRGLFAWYTYRQISQLKISIKRVGAEIIPDKKKQPPIGRGCQTLLLQIQSLFSAIVSIKNWGDQEHLVDSLYPELEQIDVWRGQSVKLPFNECRRVYKNIFALEKKLYLEADELWFRIQQKMDIVETKRFLEQIKNNLNKADEEFAQKLNSTDVNLYQLLISGILHPPIIVFPLKQNRFFKLSPKDSKYPDAVEVSREIADCIKFSQQLGNSFRVRILNKKHKENLGLELINAFLVPTF